MPFGQLFIHFIQFFILDHHDNSEWKLLVESEKGVATQHQKLKHAEDI